MKTKFIEVFNSPRFNNPKNAPYGKIWVNVNNILYLAFDDKRDRTFIVLTDGTLIHAYKFDKDKEIFL